jgi:hypothetical protein
MSSTQPKATAADLVRVTGMIMGVLLAVPRPLLLSVTGRAPEGLGVAGERGRPDGGREPLERRCGSFGVSLWALG